MKNVLITGGAGFIGTNLTHKLLKAGYEVTILDNLSPQIHGKHPLETSPLYQSLINKVNFIKGNVENRKDLLKSLEYQDAVVHLAAETGTGQSMYKIQKYNSVNVGGTALLLDIIANEKHSLKKIVIASSRAVYGEGKYFCEKDGNVYPEERNESDLKNGEFECTCPVCHGPIFLLATDEGSEIHPKSIYGLTKQNQEQMVLIVGKALGIPSVALRYQNVFGPGQSLSNPYTGILSIFSTQIKNRNDLNIFEDGRESRDFVYIDDVVDATILGLENRNAEYEVFNVGSGKQMDVFTIAKSLIEIYNINVRIKISGNYRVGDIRHNYADLNKIKKFLNFSPKTDFLNGLKTFCEWVNNQKVQKDNYQYSINEMRERGLYK